MDVRILLRMGTKYVLARRTLAVVRGLLIAGLAFLLVQEVRTPEFTAGAIVRIIWVCGATASAQLRSFRPALGMDRSQIFP